VPNQFPNRAENVICELNSSNTVFALPDSTRDISRVQTKCRALLVSFPFRHDEYQFERVNLSSSDGSICKIDRLVRAKKDEDHERV
jgi:hypothetical protein